MTEPFDVDGYWNKRYADGKTSGTGSYGRLASYKALVLNNFVASNGLDSVIEFGCGDGNQLKLAEYPKYKGYDVSQIAVERCKREFSTDSTKEFALVSDYAGERADLSISLDVLYHLVEDDLFTSYMARLFASAKRFVAIYSSNDPSMKDVNSHVLHRKFTEWTDEHPNFRLSKYIENPYHKRNQPTDAPNSEYTPSDFYLFERIADPDVSFVPKGTVNAEAANEYADDVEKWIGRFGTSLEKPVPDAYAIWKKAQRYLADGNLAAAARCQSLNYVLHNSFVPNRLKMGPDVRFGYGGIGLVIHETAEIGRGVAIGANVTLGGESGGKRRTTADGQSKYAPLIEDFAYIATGAKVLGGVTVGAMSIVGANAVVDKDVAPLSIVAGAPARIIGKIGIENAARYQGTYLAAKNMSKEEFVAMVRYYGREITKAKTFTDWERPVASHSYMARRNVFRLPNIVDAPQTVNIDTTFDWSSVAGLPPDAQKWLHSLIGLRALLNHSSRAFHDVSSAAILLKEWSSQNPWCPGRSSIAWSQDIVASRSQQVAAIWVLGFQEDWMQTTIAEHLEAMQANRSPATEDRTARATQLLRAAIEDSLP